VAALAHDVAGEGRAVCLIHSGVCDRRMWEPQWQALAARFRVVRPDLRGFGETALGEGPFDHAGDVLELLDRLGIEQTALVGSSLGGRVALEAAAAQPERVERLVLLCTGLRDLPLSEDAIRFAEEEEALLERGDVDGATELNVRTWLGPDAPAETRELVREMQRHAFELQLVAPDIEDPPPRELPLERVAAPVLVVSGGRDLHHFQAIAEHLARDLPDARRVPLEWAAHLPSLERPDEVTRLLLDFLGA
jgi:3-oxoadipate enol-lactonase